MLAAPSKFQLRLGSLERRDLLSLLCTSSRLQTVLLLVGPGHPACLYSETLISLNFSFCLGHVTALALLCQPVPLELGGLPAEAGVGCDAAWIMEVLSLLNKIEKESVTVSILVTSSGQAVG